MDQGTQEPFHNVIGRVIIRTGKILFQNMGHNIKETGNHLILRQRKRIFRIKDREFRKDIFFKDTADFAFLRMIGNTGTAVHFRARADHGKDTPDGDNLIVHPFLADIVFFPRIIFTISRHGYAFGIVADRTAADGKKQIGIVLSSDFRAFRKLIGRGIGHNSRIFNDILAVGFKDRRDAVVNTVLFNRTAAVNKNDFIAVLRQFPL